MDASQLLGSGTDYVRPALSGKENDEQPCGEGRSDLDRGPGVNHDERQVSHRMGDLQGEFPSRGCVIIEPAAPAWAASANGDQRLADPNTSPRTESKAVANYRAQYRLQRVRDRMSAARHDANGDPLRLPSVLPFDAVRFVITMAEHAPVSGDTADLPEFTGELAWI